MFRSGKEEMENGKRGFRVIREKNEIFNFLKKKLLKFVIDIIL